MKLLFLTSRLPFPPHRGDRLRVYGMLNVLARRHEITLLSLVGSPEEAALAAGMGSLCARVETVLHPSRRAYANMAGGLFQPAPLQVSYFRSEEYARRLQHLLAEERFDVVHTHLIRMAPYSAELASVPSVIDLTDSLSLHLERQQEIATNPVKKALLRMEHGRMRRCETRLDKFSRAFVCSPVDQQSLRRSAPDARIELLRNGLNLSNFDPTPGAKDPQSIVFTGNMTYAPNEDAVQYFYRDVFPLIRRRMPQAHLWVVGNSPSKAVQRLGEDAGVTVTGFVPAMQPYYARAQVAICPIRFGAGTCNKTTEAMAMGLPVVSTAQASAGLNVRDGESILIADGPAAYSEAVLSLLGDPARAQRIGAAGRRLMEEEHDWERIVRGLEGHYRDVVEEHAGRARQTVLHGWQPAAGLQKAA